MSKVKFRFNVGDLVEWDRSIEYQAGKQSISSIIIARAESGWLERRGYQASMNPKPNALFEILDRHTVDRTYGYIEYLVRDLRNPEEAEYCLWEGQLIAYTGSKFEAIIDTGTEITEMIIPAASKLEAMSILEKQGLEAINITKLEK